MNIRRLFQTPANEVENTATVLHTIEQFNRLPLDTVFYLRSVTMNRDSIDFRNGTPSYSTSVKTDYHLNPQIIDHFDKMMNISYVVDGEEVWKGKFKFTFYTRFETSAEYIARHTTFTLGI